MKKRDVNLELTDENIADQYDNVCEGLQKDVGQNSWDARTTSKGKDWKLVFMYHPLLNSLSLEDFGTYGMNVKRWKEYQSLWDTAKAKEKSLGARGQGKFLFHYFAKDKIVLTESIDEEGIYRFSFGTSEEYDDETKKLSDFIPSEKPLEHQGTRIWIMNLRQELRDELLDYKTFMSYIAKTWWEIIRNWNVTFIVKFDGTDHKVELPELPVTEKEKSFTNDKVSDLGKIKKLVLYYCKNEVPQHLKGIAVQRGGMTILRLPVSADDTIKNRIYGYCTFDEALEEELKRIEFPNHFGFASKRAWNHVREYIRKKSDAFVQEIGPIKKKEVALSKDLIEKAVRFVNDLVREYAPELLGEVIGPNGKTSTGKHKTPEPISPIRIDVFRGNARKLEYDESLITECELINETSDEAKLALQIEIRHEEGNLKFNPKYTIQLVNGVRKTIDVPLVDFQDGIDKSGEYKAIAILLDIKGAELHRRSFTFYLHEDPPPPKGKVFLSTMVFTNGKDTPLEKKRYLPVTEKGVLRVIFDHPDFVHAREQAGNKKARAHEIFLHAVKCGVDEVTQKLLEHKHNEGILDIDKIREIKDMRDTMYYDTVLNPME